MPKFTFQLIDPRGKVFQDLKWPTEARWAWVDGALKLRLRVKVPYVATPGNAAPDGPRVEVIGGNTLEIDADRSPLTAEVMLQKQGAATKPMPMTLLIQFPAPKSDHLIQPECARLGITSSGISPGKKYLFSGLGCVAEGGGLKLMVTASRDARLEGLPTTARLTQDYDIAEYRIALPKESNAQKPVTLLRYRVVENETSSAASYEVRFQAPRRARRLNTQAGVGSTYLIYREDRGSELGEARLNQAALTGKFSSTYVLIPGALDTNLTVYGTLLPFALGDSNVTPARFFGVNTRLGYRLPIDAGATDWSFLAGFYFWSMSTGGDYGIGGLTGPQIFITTRTQRLGAKSWFAYGKFAPIGQKLGIQNREFAVGAGLQVSRDGSPNPTTLTLDVSDFHYKDPEFENRIRLQTVSLGLGINF